MRVLTKTSIWVSVEEIVLLQKKGAQNGINNYFCARFFETG